MTDIPEVNTSSGDTPDITPNDIVMVVEVYSLIPNEVSINCAMDSWDYKCLKRTYIGQDYKADFSIVYEMFDGQKIEFKSPFDNRGPDGETPDGEESAQEVSIDPDIKDNIDKETGALLIKLNWVPEMPWSHYYPEIANVESFYINGKASKIRNDQS